PPTTPGWLVWRRWSAAKRATDPVPRRSVARLAVSGPPGSSHPGSGSCGSPSAVTPSELDGAHGWSTEVDRGGAAAARDREPGTARSARLHDRRGASRRADGAPEVAEPPCPL